MPALLLIGWNMSSVNNVALVLLGRMNYLQSIKVSISNLKDYNSYMRRDFLVVTCNLCMLRCYTNFITVTIDDNNK